jgi:hypothetical protein
VTAQIAILNKHGIALATDSAVTITGQNNQKVYNTANKLFSLSNFAPVGIMIYGSAQFLSVPWETIVKTYRKDLGESTFDTVEDYCNNFIQYITNNEILGENFAYDRNLFITLSTYLKVVLNQVNHLIAKYPEKDREPNLIADLVENEVNRLQELMKSVPFNDGFDSSFIEENIGSMNEVLDEVIGQNIFIPIKSIVVEKLKNLLVTLIAKDFYTSVSTGVVIAGYGDKEIFPSLYEFKFEGIFKGKLKYKLESKERISSEESTASVKAFAQREMVFTFMEGIDPNLQEEVFQSLYSILLEEYPKIISENLGIKMDASQEQHLGMISNEIFNQVLSHVKQYQNEKYTGPIIDTIELMPKEEIATVAETLLNLASLKKRVTMDTESVGGPIDVAIISKNDGLIWIKRKHYFKPELNYRFFNSN